MLKSSFACSTTAMSKGRKPPRVCWPDGFRSRRRTSSGRSCRPFGKTARPSTSTRRCATPVGRRSTDPNSRSSRSTSGKLCNMTCRHCHVDAGPDRTDAMMSRQTVEACLAALDKTNAHTVDLTGGAPELHPDFRYLVDEARKRGKHVIDRCNLTILLTRKMADLPEWFAERGVEVVCSLPHYGERNTDAQRGDGTFEKSSRSAQATQRSGLRPREPRAHPDSHVEPIRRVP